jgi:hypothetical protein
MVNPVAFGDRPEAFTGFEPGEGFLLLMLVQLRIAAESGATLGCGDAASLATPQDARALLLGQARQQA